jgi:phosphoribosylformylglycinamidine cyclo-ligase
MSTRVERHAVTGSLDPVTTSASYAGAGVDIEAGERAVELMKSSVAKTRRPEVVGGLGGFAGLFRLDTAKYRKPLLASSTDGVGTKIAIAQAANRHDTIGIDMVAMVVDDLVVVGAEPLFLTDYIATGKVVPEKIATIVSGIAHGCVLAGCTLIGGETAEHPGVMQLDDYDVSGAAVGVVEEDDALGAHLVQAGDVLIGLRSSGLHSNGFSLVRHVLFERAGMALSDTPAQLGGADLVDELLIPTRVYSLDCLAMFQAGLVHAFSHITGGGLAANLARVLPAGLSGVVDRGTWQPQPIFDLLAQVGDVPRDQMELTFNMGIGMVAVVPADRVGATTTMAAARSLEAVVLGDVRSGGHGVTLIGEYQN